MKIIGLGIVRLLLSNGRINTLPGVLHIPNMDINFIYVSKMGDAGVQTILKKYNFKII